MQFRPLIRLVTVALVVFSVGCSGANSNDDPEMNTELELVISDPSTPPDELAFSVDFVSYRITCPASGLTPYDDSVDISGSFEIVDDATPPVWTLVTSLPPSACHITLWVFYQDEVVCSGTDSLTIIEDGDPSTMNKANIVLECILSVNPPSGDADVDGTFTFIDGNYCPQLIWLGAVPSVVDPTVPAVTAIQTYSFDSDNTCGMNCDPQVCDFSTNPPVCTPGPDIGMVSTLYAPSGAGSFGDPNAFDTTYTCDPLLPGPTEICALVTDGDIECDKIRCVTVICPDLCENVVCDDGNECTRDRCDPLNGLCMNDSATDGVACNGCTDTCQAGICDATSPYVPDFVFSGNAAIDGLVQTVNTTFVNPYSGATASTNDLHYVNQSSFLGASTFDTLAGSGLGDIIEARLPSGEQALCDVERVFSLNGFDILRLADEYVMLGSMEIQGGNANDVLWANVGDDLIRGNNGIDLIDGGPGDDIIFGDAGDDTITLWPGSGFDSIDGGNGIDQVVIDAEQNQITITAAASPSYDFDVFYLGTPMAQMERVEFLVMNDGSIDLSTCVWPVGDVCNLCGNDTLNGGEECDDGDNDDLDGCAADCTTEY